MHIFELRFHDKLNVVIFKRTYIGRDDLDALAEAERLSATHAVEIWDGERRVARVKKGNLPLASMDRLAG
jgi:hypothetical protein